MKNNQLNKIAVLTMSLLMMTACGAKQFNLGVVGSNFQQSSTSSKVPIDILWVVDNSGSMETSQDNVASNLELLSISYPRLTLTIKLQ